MTKGKIDQHELEKTRIAIWAFYIGAIMFLAILGMNLAADTITHKFKIHHLVVLVQVHTIYR